MATQHETHLNDDVVFDIQKPKRFIVLMHNDDYTTMEFVVDVLMTIFNKDEQQAMVIMTTIHHEGAAVCGTYTQEIAETKVAQTAKLAKENNFPLKCTMEEE